jgi:hypothetical protein
MDNSMTPEQQEARNRTLRMAKARQMLQSLRQQAA